MGRGRATVIDPRTLDVHPAPSGQCQTIGRRVFLLGLGASAFSACAQAGPNTVAATLPTPS